MLRNVENLKDYKEDIIRSCIAAMQPLTAKVRFDFKEATKCAIALGKRQFALEVLLSTLLDLTLDRSHVYRQPENAWKGRRFFK